MIRDRADWHYPDKLKETANAFADSCYDSELCSELLAEAPSSWCCFGEFTHG